MDSCTGNGALWVVDVVASNGANDVSIKGFGVLNTLDEAIDAVDVVFSKGIEKGASMGKHGSVLHQLDY